MTTTEPALRPSTDVDTPTATIPDTTSPTGTPAAHRADLSTPVDDLHDGVLGDLLGDLLGGGLAGIFEHMEWAEEEIEKARARHPQHADRIYHSFLLLRPNVALKRMETEFVYRSHCRELLDRVAAGEDTRPGTAAEICCTLLETSLVAPLTSAAVGLYMRMWQAARFPEFREFAEAGRHHEALEKTVIDDHEQIARRKLAIPDRRLGDIDCRGLHHGEQVDCVYTTVEQLALEI